MQLKRMLDFVKELDALSRKHGLVLYSGIDCICIESLKEGAYIVNEHGGMDWVDKDNKEGNTIAYSNPKWFSNELSDA